MKAMILAAGRGKRLRPMSDRIPKPLVEVAGKPLIEYHLEALALAGFSEVVINLHWLGGQIKKRLGNGSTFGLRIEYSDESVALDVAGGIIQALDQLGDSFISINADVFTDYDFAKLQPPDQNAHLVLVENPPQHPQGDFSLVDGLVRNCGDSHHTYSGVAAFRRSFFEGLTPGKRGLAPLLIAAADLGKVSGEIYTGDWDDVGTAERLSALNQKS